MDLIFLWFAFSLLLTFFLFDVLVMLERIKYKKDWINNGMPHGVFFHPPEVKQRFFVNLRSFLAFRRVSSAWIFRIPKWAKKDKYAKMIIWSIRLIHLTNIFIFSTLIFRSYWLTY